MREVNKLSTTIDRHLDEVIGQVAGPDVKRQATLATVLQRYVQVLVAWRNSDKRRKDPQFDHQQHANLTAALEDEEDLLRELWPALRSKPLMRALNSLITDAHEKDTIDELISHLIEMSARKPAG